MITESTFMVLILIVYLRNKKLYNDKEMSIDIINKSTHYSELCIYALYPLDSTTP